MVNPVPGVNVSTPYGKRGPYWSCNKDQYGNGIHTGVDYASPSGTKVVAARPGKVVYSNHGSAFGNHQIDLIAGDGTRDFYAHMRSRAVANGKQVKAGDKLGEVGAEGNVTGPHLHFERHATEYGGWSCSVVRDPAPSINYKPSGGSGVGGDDMPLNDDDLEKIAARVNRVLGDYDKTGKPLEGQKDPEVADARLRQIENVVRRIEETVKRIDSGK